MTAASPAICGLPSTICSDVDATPAMVFLPTICPPFLLESGTNQVDHVWLSNYISSRAA